MRQQYETDYRPNYELFLAISWAVLGLLCTLIMIFQSGFPVLLTLSLTSVFFVVAVYQGTFARARYHRMKLLQRREKSFYSLEDLAEQMQSKSLFLGRGFEWTGIQAQMVSDLYRDPERLAQIKRNREGATFLHGISMSHEEPVHLLDDESKGHVHIVGTTGSGKTRLFDLLITQAILRNEAVIILDPKGDQELKNNAEAAYIRMGRHRDFTFFHPAFVNESAAINPLASRQRGSELASRVAAIIPSKPGGDPFQAFSNNALQGLFYGIEQGATNPTIMDVQRALTEGFAPLCIKALEGWAYSVGPDMLSKMKAAMNAAKKGLDDKAIKGAHFYQEQSGLTPSIAIAEMNNLIALLLHDKAHFSKMVASLVPVVGKLCSGPLATLFSPDPTIGRMPASGKVISLEQVMHTGGGVYIGLDTLSDPDVGRAMGQMILADLASLAGKNYNFGKKDGKFINIFVDEASEITNEQLIQLLNKGRGAGFRIFVATQTLSDYEARTGSAAMANMLLGNMNNTIMLRTVDVDTQERLSKRLPEVPLTYVMKTTGSSVGDTTITGAFSKNHGERLMSEDKPIIAPQSFGDLSDLEYFAVFSKGNLVKGRLPILDPPKEGYVSTNSQHHSRASMEISYPHDLRQSHWAAPADPIAAPPVQHIELPDYLKPVPHERRRMFPFVRWVDVLPGFRNSDQVPAQSADSYLLRSGLVEADEKT